MASKTTISTYQQASFVLDGIDLGEFNRQKAIVTQKANAALAERVQSIRGLLIEMQNIVDITGVGVNISDLAYEVQESRETLNRDIDWDSSSSNC